jgi:hypothetical protein
VGIVGKFIAIVVAVAGFPIAHCVEIVGNFTTNVVAVARFLMQVHV